MVARQFLWPACGEDPLIKPDKKTMMRPVLPVILISMCAMGMPYRFSKLLIKFCFLNYGKDFLVDGEVELTLKKKLIDLQLYSKGLSLPFPATLCAVHGCSIGANPDVISPLHGSHNPQSEL